ncbi:hypothetical protein [Hirschia maritima]|uniref:hypothetical protein n=1 Tax=Hirschia maritima TaxID=1121961 RepID=UPI000378D547|nr:hypothetical protein [Hirschia maritima]
MTFSAKKFLHLLLFFIPTFGLAIANADDFTSVPASPEYWELHAGQEWETTTIAGREAFTLSRPAIVKDLELSRGTIEVDIIRSSPRHFAGVLFHANESVEPYNLPFNESVYVRMHKANSPDAMQYTPHFNGESNWQMLANAQTANAWPQNEWFTLRVEFTETQARASIITGKETKPLNIPTLKNNKFQSGHIGIWALFKGHYSNFRYSTQTNLSLETTTTPLPKTQIQKWKISQSITADNHFNFNGEDGVKPDWSIVQSNLDDGLLYVSRYAPKARGGDFEGNSDDKVLIKIPVKAEKTITKQLNFDFSDQVTIHLNGEPLFKGNNSFRAKGPLFRGDFNAKAQSIFLPLTKGKNEIVFELEERANGWGLSAEFDNLEDIHLPLQN